MDVDASAVEPEEEVSAIVEYDRFCNDADAPVYETTAIDFSFPTARQREIMRVCCCC